MWAFVEENCLQKKTAGGPLIAIIGIVYPLIITEEK